jgi:hypothetical protein
VIGSTRLNLMIKIAMSFQSHVTDIFWVGLCYNAVSIETSWCKTVGWLVNYELQRIWNNGAWPNRCTIPVFVWRDSGRWRNISVGIAGVLGEIQTDNLRNTSLESYRYASMFDTFLFAYRNLEHQPYLWVIISHNLVFSMTSTVMKHVFKLVALLLILNSLLVLIIN